MRLFFFLLFSLVCLWGGINYFTHTPIQQPPGMLAPYDPRQTEMTPALLQIQRNQHTWNLQKVAAYDIQGRVLSTHEYGLFDASSEVSPLDVAMGWGPMSDQRIISQIDISQTSRFYLWHVQRFPIPGDDIVRHSANVHTIPADAAVEKQLKALRSGEIIRMKGYLVNVSRDNGFQWRTSTTRWDSGNGACEIMYVDSVEKIQ